MKKAEIISPIAIGKRSSAAMSPAPPQEQKPSDAHQPDAAAPGQQNSPRAATKTRRLARTGAQEKRLVALSSVLAAVGLTSFKLVVGLLSGSLGILAEAAHSGLDLVAALMTFVAVRVADRPPDVTHNYGHAKVENLSAFLEAGLLVLTAIWVIYEAIRRLIFHEGQVDPSIWTFLVMGTSIVVDYTRSRALLRVAKKQGSQALEADALHFRTDIWSSVVVILGLTAVKIGQMIGVPWLGRADAVSALGVSLIVIWVSFRLVRETLDVLLDRAPERLGLALERAAGALEGVVDVRRVRVRRAGNKLFADVVVGAPRTATFEHAHAVTEAVERTARNVVRASSPQSEVDVVVHVEPAATPAETTAQGIHYLALELGLRAHDVRVRVLESNTEPQPALEADLHLEVDPELDLKSGARHLSGLSGGAPGDNPSGSARGSDGAPARCLRRAAKAGHAGAQDCRWRCRNRELPRGPCLSGHERRAARAAYTGKPTVRPRVALHIFGGRADSAGACPGGRDRASAARQTAPTGRCVDSHRTAGGGIVEQKHGGVLSITGPSGLCFSLAGLHCARINSSLFGDYFRQEGEAHEFCRPRF
jgi:cation diffusion facilitator family transporter